MTYKQKIIKLIFSIGIILFFIGVNFRDNPQGGWQLQVIDGLGGRSISDIFFLDSSNGWAVTSYIYNDSAFVLKTTNGGDSWFISNKKFNEYVGYNKIKFINNNTGYLCGKYQSGNFAKSTDGGYNWTQLNVPNPTVEFQDMSILNEDTIWLVSSSTITGGVFRTTNGGLNWTQQLAAGNQNPDKIYMYNARIGFISGSVNIRKTTNGGDNWFVVANTGFWEISFLDSLNGWRAAGYIAKTTDGGYTWIQQILPQGIPGHTVSHSVLGINANSNGIIWGVGSLVSFQNLQTRGILLRTTNFGQSWYYQLPDTSFNIFRYQKVKFINDNTGWAYGATGGIHTTTGGDTTFYTGIQQISSEVPQDFSLGQNYPNPFNSRTVIEYEIRKQSKIKITVYDITGKGVICLVDHTQSAGRYQVDFPGPLFPSGVYFYEMTADGKQISVKKMIMTK